MRPIRKQPLRPSDDRGVALVVAMMVVLIVVLLANLVLADAFHSVVGSADARARLASIEAAESGVSWYTKALESGGLAGLTGGVWSGSGNSYATTVAQPVAGMPGSATFSLSATYGGAFDPTTGAVSGSPCLASCTTLQGITNDALAKSRIWVALQSTGASAGVRRNIRVVLELRPVHGSVSGAYAGLFICTLGNRFSIYGPNADLYLIGAASGGCPNSSLTVTSGQFTTTGSVFVLQGGAQLTSTTKIDGDLIARGAITLGRGRDTSGIQDSGTCSSTNAQVLVCGDALSLNATVPSTSHKYDTSKVLGAFAACASCALPTISFAQIPISSSDPAQSTAITAFPSPWHRNDPSAVSASWFSTTVSSSKELYVLKETGTAGGLGPADCPTRWSMPSGTLYLKNDTAIVSPCGFEFSGRVEIRKAPSLTFTPTLYLMSGWTSLPCLGDPLNPRTPLDPRDIVFNQNFDASAVRLYVYTPCKLVFTNQTNITGQVLARQLYAQGRTTINTVDLLGLSGGQPGPITSFQVRVVDLREL